MKGIALILFFTPSFIHVFVRKILGDQIGKKTKIKFGTLIFAKKITLGNEIKIGPFSYINCNEFSVGDQSTIKPLCVISATKIILHKYVHLAPLSIISGDHTINSHFIIGDHSRVFPFCWIDTGEGVEIGKHVGIGGHTLIFTHGVWADYLDGGPVSYGPVKINDNVWLPWRVFIMPNVEIGKNAIIGANSLVNKSIPENVVAAGSPAKIVKDVAIKEISNEEKLKRTLGILTKFSEHLSHRSSINSSINNNSLVFENFKISIDHLEKLNKGDLVISVSTPLNSVEKDKLKSNGISYIDHINKEYSLHVKNQLQQDFISYLRRFGIRLTNI